MATPRYKQIRFDAFVTDGVGPVFITINRASPTGTYAGRNTYDNDDLKFALPATDILRITFPQRLLMDSESFLIEKVKQENGLILTTDINEITLDSPFIFSGISDGGGIDFDLYAELSSLFEWHLYDINAKYRLRIIRQRPNLTFEHLFAGDFRRKDFTFTNRGITSEPESDTELSQKQVTINAAPLVQTLKDVRVQDLQWSLSDMWNAEQTSAYTGLRYNILPGITDDQNAPIQASIVQLLKDYANGKNPIFNTAEGAQASAHLFFDPLGTISNGQTVTINLKTYTFQTTLTNVDGNVQIGSNIVNSLINLLYAINTDPNFAGVAYATATTDNTDVYCNTSQVGALGVSLNALYITSLVGGTLANSYTVSTTGTDIFWNAATLSGGAGAPNFDPPYYAVFGFPRVQKVEGGRFTDGMPILYNPVFPAGAYQIKLETIFTKIFSHPDIDITLTGYDDLPIKGFSQLWTGSTWDVKEDEAVNTLATEYCSWNGLFGFDPNSSFPFADCTNTSPILLTVSSATFPSFLNSGDTVVVSGVLGNTNANGTWNISLNAARDQITLIGSQGNGTWAGGGVVGRLISSPVTYSPETLLFDVIRDFLLQCGYLAECGCDTDGNPSVYLRDRRSINGTSVPASYASHVVGDTKPTTEDEFIPAPVLTLQYKGDDDKITVDHLPLPTDTQINLTIPLRTHCLASANNNVFGRHLIYNSKLPIDQQIQSQLTAYTSYGIDNVPNGWLPFAFLYRNYPNNTFGSRVFPPSQFAFPNLPTPDWTGNFAVTITQLKDDIDERAKFNFNYGEGIIYTLAQFYANVLNVRPTLSVLRMYNKLADSSGDISWLKPGVSDSFFWYGEVRNWEAIKTSIDLKNNSVTITYVEQPDYETLQEYKIITVSSSNSSGGGASSATDGGSGGANPPGSITTGQVSKTMKLIGVVNGDGEFGNDTFTFFPTPTDPSQIKVFNKLLLQPGVSYNYSLVGSTPTIVFTTGNIPQTGDYVVIDFTY